MRLKTLFVPLCVTMLAVAGYAADGSSLKPPAGAPVALIVFEDLECPSCAQASPLLEQASKTYSVPLIIHDFPLPMHPWAYDAAIIARYIQEKYGEPVSNEFRDYVYQYQPQITKDALRSYADNFAKQHHIELPFAMDPQGKIRAAIESDKALGQKVGLTETPTIFVVSTKDWKQVTDRSQLYTIIDQMKRANPAPAASAAKSAPKTSKRSAAKKKSE